MSRVNTFYLAPELWQEPFLLQGDEAHHLIRVLRAQPGCTVRLFDGQGRTGLFHVQTVGKKDAALAMLKEQLEPAAPCPLILALGWSKHLRRTYILEKAVELGASQIWFWQAGRSQGEIPPSADERWERQLIPAAKQCRAAWLPQVRTFASPRALCAAAMNIPQRLLCWEQEQTRMLDPHQFLDPSGAIAVLGPEGGLEATEVETFTQCGFIPVRLGPSILRHETAALFVLSLHHWAAWSDRS